MPLDVCSGYALPLNCEATVPGLTAASLHIHLVACWVNGASFVHASALPDVLGDSGLPSSVCILKAWFSAPRHRLASRPKY